MSKKKTLVVAAMIVILSPLYVHVAQWQPGVASYIAGSFLVTGWALIISNARQMMQWIIDLIYPGFLLIRDSIGSMLIGASRRVRHLGDRMFTVGFRMRVYLRGGMNHG